MEKSKLTIPLFLRFLFLLRDEISLMEPLKILQLERCQALFEILQTLLNVTFRQPTCGGNQLPQAINSHG